jgi:hypothetical protein
MPTALAVQPRPRVRSSRLDELLPAPDVRERFTVDVRAPAALVMDVATHFDLQSPRVVRAIIRLREMLLGTAAAAPRQPQGLLEETRAQGWELLAEEPDRLIVCGAVCQPWKADVVFTPLPAEAFAAYADPGQVKIAWTLEAEPLGGERTRFTHETRAAATDAASRARFRRYWRWARFGVIAIRLVLMPAVRREAERRARRSAA